MSSSPSMILQPEQQQQAGPGEAQMPAMTTPEAVPTASAWESSGSIGPFFAVISVLTALAVISCYLGRKWNPSPDSIENDNRSCFGWLKFLRNRSCFGWLKFLRRPCIPTPVQVKNVNKSPAILASTNKDDCKVEEGEVAVHNLHPQV